MHINLTDNGNSIGKRQREHKIREKKKYLVIFRNISKSDRQFDSQNMTMEKKKKTGNKTR